MLSHNTVIKLASVLTLDDEVFVVGGQAFNLWAERYAANDAALAEFGPFTSKDLDYFGHAAAAQKLAQALNGVVKTPSLDDATPNAAIVEAEIDGEWVEIDFVTNVIGVRVDPLKAWAIEMVAPFRTEAGESGQVAIPVMHPLHCFQSRVSNVVRLGRADDTAVRQIKAAPVVLGHYLDEQLRTGDFREVQDTLVGLTRYLTGEADGRAAHMTGIADPLEILKRFAGDERLDARYRQFNMQWMIRKVQSVRVLRSLRVLG